MYTICMCIVVGCVMSAGYISGGDLVTQWFPKKKGIVMGYTTMGHNLASVAYVPLITFLVGRYGIGNGAMLLVLFVDEYRFNKDWHQGKTIEEKK